MSIKIQAVVFLAMTSCTFVNGYRRFWAHIASVLHYLFINCFPSHFFRSLFFISYVGPYFLPFSLVLPFSSFSHVIPHFFNSLFLFLHVFFISSFIPSFLTYCFPTLICMFLFSFFQFFLFFFNFFLRSCLPLSVPSFTPQYKDPWYTHITPEQWRNPYL